MCTYVELITITDSLIKKQLTIIEFYKRKTPITDKEIIVKPVLWWDALTIKTNK